MQTKKALCWLMTRTMATIALPGCSPRFPPALPATPLPTSSLASTATPPDTPDQLAAAFAVFDELGTSLDKPVFDKRNWALNNNELKIPRVCFLSQNG
jgi:hypothetical protein